MALVVDLPHNILYKKKKKIQAFRFRSKIAVKDLRIHLDMEFSKITRYFQEFLNRVEFH